MLRFYENDSILNGTFVAFTQTTNTFDKNKRCYMTLEGLSSVCVKLEPASYKNNEILEINVLKNLHRMIFTAVLGHSFNNHKSIGFD